MAKNVNRPVGGIGSKANAPRRPRITPARRRKASPQATPVNGEKRSATILCRARPTIAASPWSHRCLLAVTGALATRSLPRRSAALAAVEQ